MVYGDKAEWLIDACISAGNPIPSAILNKPDLPLYLLQVWEGFIILNTTRQSGFGFQPISLAEIKAYFDIYGIAEDKELFVIYIKYLDHILLDYKAAQNDRRSNKGAHNKRRGNAR